MEDALDIGLVPTEQNIWESIGVNDASTVEAADLDQTLESFGIMNELFLTGSDVQELLSVITGND